MDGTFTYKRKRWYIKERKELRDDEGNVCWALLDYKNRTIWLDSDASRAQKKSGLMHELFHLGMPWMDEDAILDLEALVDKGASAFEEM